MINKNEQFKKILRSFVTIFLVALQTAVFAHIWITKYNNFIVLPFVQKIGGVLIHSTFAAAEPVLTRLCDSFPLI